MSSIAVKWSHSKDVLSRKLSPAALAVLRTLCYVYFDGTEDRRPKSKAKDDCYPTLNYLKDHTGFSVSAIKRARNELANEHLISWVTFGKGKGQSCAYQLNCPALHKVIWNNRRVSITFKPMPLKNANSKKSSKNKALMGSQRALENGSQRATTSNEFYSLAYNSLEYSTTPTMRCGASSVRQSKTSDDAPQQNDFANEKEPRLKTGEFAPLIPSQQLQSELPDSTPLEIELLRRLLHIAGDPPKNRKDLLAIIRQSIAHDPDTTDMEMTIENIAKQVLKGQFMTDRVAYIKAAISHSAETVDNKFNRYLNSLKEKPAPLF